MRSLSVHDPAQAVIRSVELIVQPGAKNGVGEMGVRGERHLPDGHRQRSTWQHVEKQLNAAANGEVETIDVAVPLRLVLQLERVPCLPQ